MNVVKYEKKMHSIFVSIILSKGPLYKGTPVILCIV